MGVFIILDLVGFYILFEGVLIPMFSEEKVQASYYYFYTFIGSVFMVLAIYFCMIKWGPQIIDLYVVNSTKESYNILFL